LLPFFILLSIISTIGIGVVLWLLKNDQGVNNLSVVKLEPNQLTPSNFNPITRASSEKNTKASFLNILNFLKPKGIANAGLGETVLPKNQSTGKNILNWLLPRKKKESTDLAFKEQLETEKKMFYKNRSSLSTASGTASLRTNDSNHPQISLSREESFSIEKTIESSSKIDELRSKYERLDKLFKEKSLEFDRTSETLNNELRVKKEFNKVKDILEKELTDTREKVRLSQSDLNTSQIENDGSKKRIEQLEEKVTTLEKELLQKEESTRDFDKTTEKLTQLQSSVMPLEWKITELQKNLIQKEEIITEQNNKIEQLTQTQISINEVLKPMDNMLPIEPSSNADSKIDEPQPNLPTIETIPEQKSPDEFLSLKPDVLLQPPPEPPKPE
jgi:hypothetical protein